MNGFQLCNTADSVVTSSRERKIRSAATAVPRRSDQNSYPGRDLCSIRRERKTLSRTSPRLFFGFQTIVPPWDMADRYSLSLSLSLSLWLSLSLFLFRDPWKLPVPNSVEEPTVGEESKLNSSVSFDNKPARTAHRVKRTPTTAPRRGIGTLGQPTPWFTL